MLMSNCQIYCSASGDQSCLMVTNPRVVRDIVRTGKTLHIATDRCFVLAMSGDRQSRFRKDPLQRHLIINQQISGARANEDLDPRGASGGGQLVDIVRRRSDVETVVHQTLPGSQLPVSRRVARPSPCSGPCWAYQKKWSHLLLHRLAWRGEGLPCESNLARGSEPDRR